MQNHGLNNGMLALFAMIPGEMLDGRLPPKLAAVAGKGAEKSWLARSCCRTVGMLVCGGDNMP